MVRLTGVIFAGMFRSPSAHRGQEFPCSVPVLCYGRVDPGEPFLDAQCFGRGNAFDRALPEEVGLKLVNSGPYREGLANRGRPVHQVPAHIQGRRGQPPSANMDVTLGAFWVLRTK